MITIEYMLKCYTRKIFTGQARIFPYDLLLKKRTFMHRIFAVLIAIAFTAPLLGETVLVVGGAGFIGSHVNKKLAKCGYQTVVLDNLSRGDRRNVQHGVFVEGDMADSALLDHIFTTYSIDAVMHFASHLEVSESVANPLKYYKNNVAGTLTLLEAMQRHHVDVFIFSSSAAVYGTMQEGAVNENSKFCPVSPYGRTKLMIETILSDLGESSSFRFCSLRYFNAAGGDPDGELKNYNTKEFHLIPIVLRSLQTPGKTISIFGTDYPTPDGTAVRDYIHVEDLATAHIAAMRKLFSGARSKYYNLGTGRGFSVREVIDAVEAVTQKRVDALVRERRAGDPAFVVASAEKARRELGWKPRYSSLETMIEHAWLALQD
jgi:UDP-glucose 4-epimerase